MDIKDKRKSNQVHLSTLDEGDVFIAGPFEYVYIYLSEGNKFLKEEPEGKRLCLIPNNGTIWALDENEIVTKINHTELHLLK